MLMYNIKLSFKLFCIHVKVKVVNMLYLSFHTVLMKFPLLYWRITGHYKMLLTFIPLCFRVLFGPLHFFPAALVTSYYADCGLVLGYILNESNPSHLNSLTL